MKTLKPTIWTLAGLLGLFALAVTPAAADQVILDDLIVDGSLCVGFDCVNGESFGFDTMRLKENNLRIHFDDTSTSASFPNNEFRITINDSSNGGGNYFSIDDASAGRQMFKIEAGAPSNSLYVDDGGRLGLGTSTPVVDLHVKSGNTPTLRLEQDGSSGFTPQTWDAAGNEANFFIRDATNGSTLPFRIQPGAASNVLYLANDEQVGINTTSPDRVLDVQGSDPVVRLTQSGGGGAGQQGEFGFGAVNTQARFLIDITDRGSSTNTSVELFRLSEPGTDNAFIIYDPGTTTERFRVDADDGRVLVNTVQVHPDYVFEPNYQLMPLSDLASFISSNRHLPGIPTAEEVAGGYDLIGMQIKLLEKIEELTLYTIDQQELIDRLQARLESLEQPE